MVEPREITGVKSEEGEDKKNTPKFNKKKNSKKNNAMKLADSDVRELLRGVNFSVAKNVLHPTQTEWECYDHTEGNVEDPYKQHHQAWRVTRGKPGGDVQGSTIYLWPCTERPSM